MCCIANSDKEMPGVCAPENVSLVKSKTATCAHMLGHTRGQDNGTGGAGPVVGRVVFNCCVDYRCVSVCLGSGQSSRVSARGCV